MGFDATNARLHNHTLLPEALEKWPVEWFQMLIPRHLEIIYEINRRLLDTVRQRYPGDDARVERISLIEEGPADHVRMANLAIVGSIAPMASLQFTRSCCERSPSRISRNYSLSGLAIRRMA